MMAGVLAGSNFIFHAAGGLEGGLTMGYEKFVMDLDHCGMMLKMIGGLDVSEDTMARPSYDEVGPGQTFLQTDHTLANFETANYVSELPDPGTFEQWTEAGAQDAQIRANRRWKQMLTNYEAPPIDGAIDEALCEYVARKKDAVPDEWY
jgi:trimethylamine--corrinoid protein Co-methyltransferase